MTIMMDAFAADPFADHSARFPLSRANRALSNASPSDVAVDRCGRRLVNAAPTAEKQSNNDGDEGPSEDWKNDFCPDSPYSV